MTESRSALYDNVKLFLIACVVVGHIGNHYSQLNPTIARIQFWIYLFHMPAFIFIAGMFSKRTIGERRWDRVVPYILLYLFMRTMSMVYSFAAKGTLESVKFFRTDGVPWFALAMFWWYAVTILIQDVHPAYVLTMSVGVAAISGYGKDVNSFLVMQRSINFFPIFYLGYLIDPIKLKDFLKRWQIKVVSILILLISLLVSFQYFDSISYWRYLFRGLKTYAKIKKGLPAEWGWSWRILGYAVSLLLTFAIISLMPDIKSFFSNLGKRTLAVFAFHNIGINLFLRIKPFAMWMTSDYLTVKCLVFAVAIVLLTSLKPFDWFVHRIMTVPKRNTQRE